MEQFVWPGKGQELLPPSGSHIRDIKTKNEGEGNEIEECIEVFHYAFKQPETGIVNIRIKNMSDTNFCCVSFISCL